MFAKKLKSFCATEITLIVFYVGHQYTTELYEAVQGFMSFWWS